MRLRARANISAHAIWDALTRPLAISVSDVPWCAEAVTPAWLAEVLCRDTPGAEVVSIKVDGGSAGTSVRRRIQVAYNDVGEQAGLPQHFFAKTTPTILTRVSSGTKAINEATFFERVRPGLPIEAPVQYFSAVERGSGRSLHLMENMVATKQARFCNYETVITRDHANQIVDLMATLHGTLYDSPRFGGDLDWVPTFEHFFETGERGGMRLGHEEGLLAAEAVVPADVMARRDEIWDLGRAGLQIHRTGPRTLLHSDIHLGNWYITGAGRVGICDFAEVCTGHWSRDFAYALSTTLAPEDRRQWERPLLERYLAKMAALTGATFDFDEAWLRYRQQTFAALFMWTSTLRHPATLPDMQPEEMSLEMIRRISIAISDLRSLDSHSDR